MLELQLRFSQTSVEMRPRMSNYLIQTIMGKKSYTPIPHFLYPIPESQLILVIQKVLIYFLTCVSGHRAKERAGSTVRLWSSRKVMVVMLSLLTNHFSHFGTYLDVISADEELFVMVVASSVVDILDPISALVGVRLKQPIRMSRIKIDVIMKYAVGMKMLLWRTFIKKLSWCQRCPHFGVASDHKVGIMTFLCFHSLEHSW